MDCTQSDPSMTLPPRSSYSPEIPLDWRLLSLAKRWQLYLSSDGEIYAVCGGAGSPRARHRCRYCCCCCYCLLLNCRSMLTSRPADSLAPEHTPWVTVTKQICSKIWKWSDMWNF